jgi:hypothetical protein
VAAVDPKAFVLSKINTPAVASTPPVKVLLPPSLQVPVPDLMIARLPPPEPSEIFPFTALFPVLVPFKVSVVVFPDVETPVTLPPMTNKRVAVEDPAVKVADPLSD